MVHGGGGKIMDFLSFSILFLASNLRSSLSFFSVGSVVATLAAAASFPASRMAAAGGEAPPFVFLNSVSLFFAFYEVDLVTFCYFKVRVFDILKFLE